MPSTIYDFSPSTGALTAGTDIDLSDGGAQTAGQTIGGNTLTLTLNGVTVGSPSMGVANEIDYYGGNDLDGFSGNMLGMSPDGYAESLTMSMDGGKVFDLTSLVIVDHLADSVKYVFTTSKGTYITNVVNPGDNGNLITLSNSVLLGVNAVTISLIGGTGFLLDLDNIKLDNIRAANTAPTFVGSVTTLPISQNGGTFDVRSLLHVSDVDSAQTLTWSQSAAPGHGTLSFTGSTAASGSADIGSGGSLTYTPTAGFAGRDTFTVQVSDGTATATRQITVDVTPASSSTPDLAAGSDTGAALLANRTTDNITSAASLNFSGTSAAGDSASTVLVFLDTNNNGSYDIGTDKTATATVGNGSWSVSGLSTVGVADGDYNVYAQITSSDGNLVSARSTGLAVHIDKTAPTQTVDSLSLSPDTGSSSSDFITNVAAQTVSATLSGGLGTKEYLYGSVDNGNSWVDISSKVSGTTVTWDGVTLSGSNALKLKVVDAAGNESTTTTQVYSLDTTAPSTPSTPDLTPGSDTGALSNDNLTDDTTPTFNGVGEIGSTVKLYDTDGTTEVGTAVVNGAGKWTSTTSTLSGGSHTITAKAFDVAGNVSTASNGLTVDIHTTNTAPTGDVTISGTATDGQTLTASNTLADADGLGTISYQWQSDGADIVGETTSSLTLASAQVGHAITVVASYTDGFNHAESVASSATTKVGALNQAPGGSVTVTGTATQGQTLTAGNTLTDADGLGTISYQWKSDGADIVGATASTLTLAQAQVGHAITVVASYTDGLSKAESVASTATSSVANINDAPGGAVSITGTATQGQTLTAGNTLTDADGMGTISYQWKSDGADIVGATASTLTLAQAQVGHAITVVASYTDGFSHAESVASTATGSVANINDAPGGSVTVTGTATQGQTLTASNTLTDADGLGTISYQWKSDGANIAGATASTLTLGQAQVGHAISVVASYTDGFSHAEAVTSTATGSVGNINDAPTGALVLSGAAEAGATLTASTAAIVDLDGLGAFSYVWKADGATIGGATAADFTLTSSQIGKAITVTVSYTDGFGHAESVVSTATAAVQPEPAPPPPPTTTPPVVTPPTLPEVIAAAGDALGVDTSSPKTTAPTVVLPNGASVVNPVFAAVQEAKIISGQLTAGLITTGQATELLINLAAPTQIVAHETYNFFTGTPPTAVGFTYLIDSPNNATDLTDSYYAGFNTLNRFINFAVNLGSIGDGKSDFQTNYGALTFEQAVAKAYDAVIGDQSARGFDPVASKAYVLSQLPYFKALGGDDLGAKAAMIGFLLGVGAAEHVGPYYQAAHDYVAPQVQLVASVASSAAEFV